MLNVHFSWYVHNISLPAPNQPNPGSILRPTLLIFINNLPVVINSQLGIYTEDTTNVFTPVKKSQWIPMNPSVDIGLVYTRTRHESLHPVRICRLFFNFVVFWWRKVFLYLKACRFVYRKLTEKKMISAKFEII